MSVVGTEMVPLVTRCLEVLDLACSHIDSLVNQAEEYQVTPNLNHNPNPNPNPNPDPHPTLTLTLN